MTHAVTQLADTLMRAVVASGAVREEDADIACKIMRAEMKAFLMPSEDPANKYQPARELAQTGLPGAAGLAMASLTAECIKRILEERNGMPAA